MENFKLWLKENETDPQTAAPAPAPAPAAGPLSKFVNQPQSNHAPTPLRGKRIKEVSIESILEMEGNYIADFFSPTCGPCRMLMPILEMLAEIYEGRIQFVKTNVDDNLEMAGHLGINALPTLFFQINGQNHQVIGLKQFRELKNIIEEMLGPS